MTVIGIDPGLNGGIATVVDGVCIESVPMPLWKGCIRFAVAAGIVKMVEPDHVFIEDQFAGYGKRRGAQSIVLNYGRLLQALSEVGFDAGVTLTRISQKDWKDVMIPRRKKREHKAASIAKCSHLYPNISLQPGRCTTDQDGLSDAALIATYGWRMMNGESK